MNFSASSKTYLNSEIGIAAKHLIAHEYLGGNCNACISVVVYFQVVVHLSFFCFLNIKCILFHILFFQELRYWQ